jgi:rubrerythrin
METADQEKEHAKRMFKWLEGGPVEITAKYPAGVIGTTLENLKTAAEGETITDDFKYSVSDGILTIEPGEDMFLENKANIPFTIKGNKLTLVFDSETIMEENGAAITIHFEKK